MKDTSSPAFPVAFQFPKTKEMVAIQGGLTKREWFAGQALPLMAIFVGDGPIERIARMAFALADDMIAEGSKE